MIDEFGSPAGIRPVSSLTGRGALVEDSIAIEVRDAVKRFGSVTALAGVSLTIRDNEFFTLLGPSGCGKTTLLRLIAGFEDITEGTILLYGEELGDLPPNKRPINTVFQHYALFPHMTVAENVAFGMRRLGWSKADIEDQTARILDLVKLGDLAARRPSQLSGGQQQRVALARAMAPGPRVLLLDEPLSALDLKLRQAMRIELKQIQKDTGITFVFVTHDQEEALTMSDRIAVMSAGEIRQVGTPHEIYEAPVDRFVANFIGETNVLDVTVQRGSDGAYTCRLSNGAVFPCQAAGTPPEDGATAHVLIRPERLSFVAAEQGDRGLTGVINQTVYLGTDIQYGVRLDGGPDGGPDVMVRAQNAGEDVRPYQSGDRVGLTIAPGAARLLVD